MKRDAKVRKIMITLTIILAVLVIAGLSFFKATGMSISVITEEEGVFEIMGGQVTQEYVLVGIKNIGTKDYLINEINITNCGRIAGENITTNNVIKIFSVPCDNLLTKDTEFKENLTITYSCEEFNNKTQKITILGNVSSKKCIYEIYNEQIPFIVNECVNRTDCAEQIFKARDEINEKRRANNQSEINSNNITVLDCSYE